ncbi:conserved hypothetical protein [Roseibium sp. TrichSKD4]|uniref:hypothetical protein n=1 Tax=Roseibium sp. TrichSKD4 TaxID=744980 RepID=UPI0001E56653|nr:hypothetical protein [Roseibium sp. TrichSKD4]EFO30155.1 conserved hypothetical protein [Roseibium sp. TrichSKD4]EFO33565.1 conserved hypothetical protein [Roseibium sp. TrichSKD4]
MAKRWTMEEDEFLFNFYCTATERMIALNDLDRSPSAIRARVKLMQDSGAWRVLEEWSEAMSAFQERYDACFINAAKTKKPKPKHLKVVN